MKVDLSPEDTQKLLARLRVHEGFSSDPYADTLGHQTIGYGHLIQPDESFTQLTPAQANTILQTDLEQAKSLAERFTKEVNQLSPARTAVVVEMAFQLGNRLFGFARFHRALCEQHYLLAALEMIDSKWADQTTKRAVTLARCLWRDRW